MNTSRTTVVCLTVALASSAVMVGCKAKLNGNITVNGTPFVPTSCRSGQVSGFTGVDLVDDSGAKLRLVMTPTSQPEVLYFPAGAPTPMQVGTCGTLTVNRTNTQINSVYNVEGQAALACPTEGAAVMGNITFANCH